MGPVGFACAGCFCSKPTTERIKTLFLLGYWISKKNITYHKQFVFDLYRVYKEKHSDLLITAQAI